MVSSEFKMNIKEWILLDKKLSETNKVAIDIRKKKSINEESILHYIKTNKMDNNSFNVGPFSIFKNTSYNLSPLNIECIETVLSDELSDRELVSKIINSISLKRESNRKPVISLKKKSNKLRSNKLKKKKEVHNES